MRTAFAAFVLLGSVSAAFAQSDKNELGLRPSQPADPPQSATAVEQSDEPDWSILNRDTAALLSSIENNTLAPPAPGIPSAGIWSGAALPNNSAFRPKAPLAGGWNAKAGVDPVTRNSIAQPVRPDLWGTPAETAGAGWAKASAPELDLPVSWDKASFDARFDPNQDQSKFGTTMSKSVPLGDRLAVTLQNGYSVTHMRSMAPAASDGMVAAPVVSGMAPPSQILDTDRSAKFSIVPTGTSFSAGGHMSTTDEKWLRSLSAEQKLFGSVNLTGKVSETPTGDLDRSLTAGFKRNW